MGMDLGNSIIIGRVDDHPILQILYINFRVMLDIILKCASLLHSF